MNRGKIVFLLIGLAFIYAGIDMRLGSIDYGLPGLLSFFILTGGGIFFVLIALKTEKVVSIIDRILS